jgi:drug/metabolite transporter (DMT)-like permease
MAALAAVNVTAIVFGATALFGKLHVSPVWIVAGRGLFAALGLALVAMSRRPTSTRPVPLTGALWTGALLVVPWTAVFASVQWGGVAVATLTFATFPLFTIVAEAIRRGRAPEGIESAAGVAVIAAVALIGGPGLAHTVWAYWSVVVGLVSAISYAAFGLCSQALGRTCDPIALSLRQNLAVALLLAPLLPFVSPAPGSATDWLWIAALGLAATAFGHQLYFFALKRLPAAVCGAVISLEPIYAIALAALLFGEPIGPIVVVSAVLIIGASLVLLRRTETA